jgi:hypothetical protein
LPQFDPVVMSVSHPSLDTVLQSAKPDAHADVGNTHWTPLHDAAPDTLVRAVQSVVHEPQW